MSQNTNLFKKKKWERSQISHEKKEKLWVDEDRSNIKIEE